MGLEREMPGLEEAHHRGGDVAPEGLGAGRQEEGIVPAPDREEGRLVGAEICLEDRIERDVALVVAEQVELPVSHARPRQIEIVQRMAVRRYRRRRSEEHTSELPYLM